MKKAGADIQPNVRLWLFFSGAPPYPDVQILTAAAEHARFYTAADSGLSQAG
jgi:hypothetical protein